LTKLQELLKFATNLHLLRIIKLKQLYRDE